MRTLAARSSLALGALIALILAFAATPALAGVGQTIVDKCAKGEPFSGYTAAQYREALKDISTTTREYSECEREIRAAEAAAAGGGTGEKAGAPHTALTLSPAEQKQVQRAHKHGGSTPVQVGNEPIRPGVVHANIASAVNTLPHALFAILALLLATAALLAGWEVRKRVRARRDADD
ncbi:MAG TPA: hypothetical protein VFW38_01295 [Solirubrobacteraceae bacterium]|nr:hypothetical protein [Solirubrobacteraceae bacterium]